MSDQYLHGVLPIFKPQGMIAKDVSRVLKKVLPKGQRLGHIGTLDPLADGVLPLAFGQGTRLQDYLLHNKKTYRVS
ncbi:MAG: tRNA pseudouridine(55) synthase TruB, partial [Proteobacteria bacterium]|nr:tRNA pseudouridine(55) synthase TruB [Pseudomonadota bacterium]